jgi:hypothetical protein
MRTVRLAIVILVAFVANASADRNVDWSQYMEKPGDKPLISTTPDVIRKAAAKPTPVAKAKKAKKAGKARKVKARSKAKSRRK